MIEIFEETIEKGVPGGEFAAALRVFGCCSDLGLALRYGKQKYDDCMAAAMLGNPKKNAAAEKACGKKWDKRIELFQKLYDKNCKGKK